MSDTPISDSTPHNVADLGMLCRKLERELNAAQQRIKRLEEAGDWMAESLGHGLDVESWKLAKEAKL
jgi:hypothetical protein